jgi:hypothetical protein
VPVGASISDTAAVSGGGSPGGSVTFQLFAPDDPTCTTPVATTTGTLTSGTASSGDITASGAGTYRWVATYGGDANNDPVASPCGSATVTVTGQRLTGRAYALSAKAMAVLGIPLVAVGPTPDTGLVSTASSSTTSVPCVAKLAILLTARGLCASVTTTGFPGTSMASASLAEATIAMLADPCSGTDPSSRISSSLGSDTGASLSCMKQARYLKTDAGGKAPALSAITLRAVKSTSTAKCGGSVGTTSIGYLAVGSKVVVSAPTQVAPNTTVHAGAVTLILNEQTPLSTPDRGLRVNAVHATFSSLGLAKVDVVVASSESHIGNCP